MSKLIDKRKRSREDDMLCDSTPLSKRINNLHLTNFEEAHNAQLVKDTSKLNPNKTLFYDHSVQAPNKLQIHQNPGDTDDITNCMGLDEHLYNPELSESQNPFYYVKNKLLHDLHLERLKRCTV